MVQETAERSDVLAIWEIGRKRSEMKTQFCSFSAFSLFKTKSRAFLAEDAEVRWEFTQKPHLGLATQTCYVSSERSLLWVGCVGSAHKGKHNSYPAGWWINNNWIWNVSVPRGVEGRATCHWKSNFLSIYGPGLQQSRRWLAGGLALRLIWGAGAQLGLVRHLHWCSDK